MKEIQQILYTCIYHRGNITLLLSNEYYQTGMLLKQDDGLQAKGYFEQSAELGNICSIYELGKLYYEGQFVDQDIEQALSNFTLAAKYNHIGSLYELSEIYKEGKGVEVDTQLAKQYYNKASELENNQSIKDWEQEMDKKFTIQNKKINQQYEDQRKNGGMYSQVEEKICQVCNIY